MDSNICINNQNQVSFISKYDSIRNKLYDGNYSVKNTTLTAGNEESLNKTKNYVVIDKNLNDKGELNDSTESNEIMNIKEKKHEASNKVKEEDEFNTVQKKQKI